MKLQRAGRFILDLVFPRRCAWCGQVVGFGQGCRCRPAFDALKLPDRELPLPALGQPTAFGALWACFSYEEPVRGAITRFKFEGEQQLAEPFGECLYEKYQKAGLVGRFDCIVPAPISAKTARTRGYNQSALLAGAVAAGSGLSLWEDALYKCRETRQQMKLDRENRLQNLREAFACTRRLDGMQVLLVDDIVTTGSTLNECAKALVAAGAAGVGALCLAATPKPPHAE